jgi:hypothetical protein
MTDFWTFVVQGCTHIIDTLVDKTAELFFLESDLGMMSWLQEWKKKTLDMEAEIRFEL